MKLRNKKTGDTGIINYFDNQCIVIYPIDKNWNAKGNKKYVYNSLAELNAEWEDYEEPEEFWFIDDEGGVECGVIFEFEEKLNLMKSIGNYFETKEEAKKAVEKLKAWKRLKDNGFKFEGWERDEKYCGDFTITATDQISCGDNDLELLFGGEE